MIPDVLVKHAFFPFFERMSGYDTTKHLKELNKSQWLPPDEIERIQLKKLGQLLKHSYDNVPYYHKIFKKLDLRPEDIRTHDDLLKLPVLTKDDIRNNYSDMIAPGTEAAHFKTATGGSTGKPLQLIRDRRHFGFVKGINWRFRQWAGWDFHTRWVNLTGESFTEEKKNSLAPIKKALIGKKLPLSTFDMSEEAMEGFVRRITEHDPKVMRGFVSSLVVLARFVERNNIETIRPDSVITISETLFDHQRKIIEDAFDCKVFNDYGCREGWVMAFDCPTHSCMHVASEQVVPEFVREGSHVTNEELGQILVTDLHNYVMPLIRYSSGDAGIPTNERCTCGRGLGSVRSIEGRIHDFILTEKEDLLPGEFFPHLFKDVTGIEEFQIVQETKGKLLLRIVKTTSYSESDLEFILENFRKYCGDLDVEVSFQKEIEPIGTHGKRRVTISKIQNSFL